MPSRTLVTVALSSSPKVLSIKKRYRVGRLFYNIHSVSARTWKLLGAIEVFLKHGDNNPNDALKDSNNNRNTEKENTKKKMKM